MTKAVDVLLIGGPSEGRIKCVNKTDGMPSGVDVYTDYETFNRYNIVKWFNATDQRWYWLGMYPSDPWDDDYNRLVIEATGFTPSWDLRDTPAPSNGTGNEEAN